MIYSLFLIHLWIGFVSCAAHHIVPSLNHHCPVESCLTLSSFAANTNLYLDSNTSLIFQPGNHTMHSPIYVKNITNFTMTSKHSSTGIAWVIFSSDNFIFEAVDHVYLRNLKFACDYNILRFFSHPSNTAIIVTASNMILLECTFEDNKRTSVISATHSNITIEQSTFKDNNGDLGSIEGGILLFNGYCNVMIVNSTFTDNIDRLLYVTINRHDVAARNLIQNNLTIVGCEFRNNGHCNDYIMIQISLEPIIYVQNSVVSITDTEFIENGETKSFISAFKSVVNIDASAFKHNHGSAIHLEECIVHIVNYNSLYDSNQEAWRTDIKHSGALTSHSTVIHIHDSEFKNNTAKTRGGAIYCSGNSIISFNETCTFAYNHAEQGGAIYLDHSVQCLWSNSDHSQ